jgi:hypothetical protein
MSDFFVHKRQLGFIEHLPCRAETECRDVLGMPGLPVEIQRAPHLRSQVGFVPGDPSAEGPNVAW